MEKFEIKIQGDWNISGIAFAPSWVGELPRYVTISGQKVDAYAVLSKAIELADAKDHEPKDGEFDIPTNTKINLPLLGSTEVKGDLEILVRPKKA